MSSLTRVSGLTACLFLANIVCAQQADPQLARLARWLKSPDASVRLDAVRELATLPPARSTPLMIGALKDPSAEIRGAAAWQLSQAKAPRVVEALRPLLKDDDDRVRAAATWSLSHVGGKAVLPDIIPLCRNDASGIVRFRAVWGLAFIGDKSALPVVIEALGDYNASVRERSALLALEQLADATVPSRLQKQATNVFAPTRRIVMYLLARYHDKTSLAVLLVGLQDNDALVRAEAALSLGKLHAQAATSDLCRLLKDPDEHARGAATYALGLIGDKDALRPMLQDEAAFVRAIAAESLQRLGDSSVKPPEGFAAAELFTYPIHSPEHEELYR
jgi:HEAT repeat protein